MDRSLFQIYDRQFQELAPLRRRIYGRLPLRAARRIVDPGCGTGLVLQELAPLTRAELVGIDRDAAALAEARLTAGAVRHEDPPRFEQADVSECRLPAAGLYVSSFFLYQLPDPVTFLRRVRRRLDPDGLYAVLAEYDYPATAESPPDLGLVEALLASLRGEDFRPETGGRLDALFGEAGYAVVSSGATAGVPCPPDPVFLRYQLSRTMDEPATSRWLERVESAGARLAFTVRWGIYRPACS
ncbi:MAG TPA: methyltransferase domain-containing protein [Acidobacteriota bacterium]|nr:methyltransferase domain-containing protein [Acidobacteriota bacterium]